MRCDLVFTGPGKSLQSHALEFADAAIRRFDLGAQERLALGFGAEKFDRRNRAVRIVAKEHDINSRP